MKELHVHNPFNQKIEATLSLNSEIEAEEMFDIAHQLFSNPDKHLSIYERRHILESAYEKLRQQQDFLAMQACLEGGKPLADSQIEVQRGLEGVQIAIRTLCELAGHCIPMGTTLSSRGKTAFTVRKPRGIVFAISAFNHPFNLVIHQVIPALAAGCPVIIKPSLETPLSCRSIIEILRDAGLPQGWCNMLLVENALAEKYVSDKRISHFNFIGSSKVGWMLRSRTAPGVTTTLEHGGSAPVIIDESADLAHAAKSLARAAFYHAGQVCISAQRLYAHRSIVEKFTQNFLSETEKLTTGNPINLQTDVGPLIRVSEIARIQEWIHEAERDGALIAYGNTVSEDTLLKPTVLVEPKEESKVMQLEVFGPVACISSYGTLNEALSRANASPYCFQSAVFTSNVNVALHCAEKLSGTCVLVNEHPAFRVDWMPFGGLKDSGQGVGGIPYAIRELTYDKLIILNQTTEI